MKIRMETVEAVIIVPEFRLEAKAYLHPSTRFSDFLNSHNKAFIPITDVQIYSRENGKLLGTIDFAAVNKESVQLIYPKMEGLEVLYEKKSD